MSFLLPNGPDADRKDFLNKGKARRDEQTKRYHYAESIEQMAERVLTAVNGRTSVAPHRTQPYAQANLRFAEGLSHLTLDVGVRVQADCPSPPTNVQMAPTGISDNDRITWPLSGPTRKGILTWT